MTPNSFKGSSWTKVLESSGDYCGCPLFWLESGKQCVYLFWVLYKSMIYSSNCLKLFGTQYLIKYSPILYISLFIQTRHEWNHEWWHTRAFRNARFTKCVLPTKSMLLSVLVHWCLNFTTLDHGMFQFNAFKRTSQQILSHVLALYKVWCIPFCHDQNLTGLQWIILWRFTTRGKSAFVEARVTIARQQAEHDQIRADHLSTLLHLGLYLSVGGL